MDIYSINDIEYGSGTALGPLQNQALAIKMTRVNWQAYLQCDSIKQIHFDLITAIDNASTKEARTAAINADPNVTAQVLIFLLNKLTKVQTLQYTLTLIDDLLHEERSRVNIFLNYFTERGESIWPHFFGFLQRGDPFCCYEASRIITKFACWGSAPLGSDSAVMASVDLDYFLNWILDQLRAKDNRYVCTVIRNLQLLLRIPQYRTAFFNMRGTAVIVEILEARSKEVQLSYQLIMCLWLVSLDPKFAYQMYKVGVVLPAVADIFCDCDKEKVIRIAAAFFRSIVEKLSETGTSMEVRDCALCLDQCKVNKKLQLLAQKDFSHDRELTEDITFLHEKLTSSVQDVSSLEEYTTELKSGRLEWSPVHKSEKFWRENINHFTARNYELLKMLIHLLSTSTEPVILSVAAFDIGEFARHYPRGKHVLEELNGKDCVMQLLTHEDANVRYQSLVSLQKIMVHNWEYLGKQLKRENEPTATGNAKAK